MGLTHKRRAAVPLGIVNAHGHLREDTEPTSGRLKLTIERGSYRPLGCQRPARPPRRATTKEGRDADGVNDPGTAQTSLG